MPRGGKRAGAGRPPTLARQEKRLAVPAKELKNSIIPALSTLAKRYPSLFEKMLEKAEHGDTNALRWVLEFPLRFIDMADIPESPITKLREQWTRTQTITVEGPVASTPERPDSSVTVDAEYTTLP